MKTSILLCTLILSTCSHPIQEVALQDYRFDTRECSITYIGHATVLIHFKNINIITDPVFSESINFGLSKRYVKPGIPFERLPKIDAILISHEHSDHLDKPTLRRFSKNIPVIISRGLDKRIRKLGFNDVRDLSWWENTEINNALITAVPAKHRLSKPSGFVIEHNNKVVYFAGDTGLSDGFKEIGQRFKIDVALLPIGDYKPHLWFIPGFKNGMRAQHMAPGDIPEAIEILQPKMGISIHWGTFKISGIGLDEPVEWLRKIIQERKLKGEVFILNHGETQTF